MITQPFTRLCLLTFASVSVLACEPKTDGAFTRDQSAAAVQTASLDAESAAGRNAETAVSSLAGGETDQTLAEATAPMRAGGVPPLAQTDTTPSSAATAPLVPATRAPSQPSAPRTSNSATRNPSANVAPVTSSTTAPALQTVRSATQRGEGFAVYLQGTSPVLVGETRRFTVVVEAVAPFKSNDKYPYRFANLTGKGVTLPHDKVTTARVTSERTTLDVEITGATPGEASVGGVLNFSVCTEEKCLVERATLSVGFAVRER